MQQRVARIRQLPSALPYNLCLYVYVGVLGGSGTPRSLMEHVAAPQQLQAAQADLALALRPLGPEERIHLLEVALRDAKMAGQQGGLGGHLHVGEEGQDTAQAVFLPAGAPRSNTRQRGATDDANVEPHDTVSVPAPEPEVIMHGMPFRCSHGMRHLLFGALPQSVYKPRLVADACLIEARFRSAMHRAHTAKGP